MNDATMGTGTRCLGIAEDLLCCCLLKRGGGGVLLYFIFPLFSSFPFSRMFCLFFCSGFLFLRIIMSQHVCVFTKQPLTEYNCGKVGGLLSSRVSGHAVWFMDGILSCCLGLALLGSLVLESRRCMGRIA